MSSTRTQYTPTTQATVLNRLRELARALPPILAAGAIPGDPDDVIDALEDVLDVLAERCSPEPLRCADCDEPLPEFRVRRRYPAIRQADAYDTLCRACAAVHE